MKVKIRNKLLYNKKLNLINVNSKKTIPLLYHNNI